MDDETGRAGWFVRAAGAVGDLSSPFYREERERDVWNEASAVGFQMMLVLGMVAAAAMIWIGGPTAQPYVLAVLGVIGVSSMAAIGYAQALGVRPQSSVRMLRWRMVPYLLLIAAVLVGLAVRGQPDEIDAATAWGAVTGAGIVLALFAVMGVRSRRRERREKGE